MKPKNIKQQRIESNRFTFTQIGLIVSLLIVFLAFEWRTTLNPLTDLTTRVSAPIAEDAPVINTGVKPPPPPPPAPKPPIQAFNEVDNDQKTDDSYSISSEARPEDETPLWEPPKTTEPEPILEPDPPFISVEQMPEFPGGEKGRLTYLRDNIQYPQTAREAGIAGSVYVSFIIEKDGSVSTLKLLRGIGGGCDQEALRVVAAMPKWKPGHQRNQPVRVLFSMEIRFTLR